jgi:hypothetical protein
MPHAPPPPPLRPHTLRTQRNYRTFLLFIYATSVFIAWTFGVSLGSLFVKHGQLVEAAAAAAGTGAGGRGGGSDGPPATDALSSNLWLQTLGACARVMAVCAWRRVVFGGVWKSGTRTMHALHGHPAPRPPTHNHTSDMT